MISEYREKERIKAVKIRDDFFKDPGDGAFLGKKRDFVLSRPTINLWAAIREDAIDYFKKNQIEWWKSKDEPTGHLLSSQIACLNHLFFIRHRQDIATEILKNILPSTKTACIIDDGFVEFEIIGQKNYLNEKSHKRGIISTSIDAMMLAEDTNNKRTLIFIEWKYTEFYEEKSLAKSKKGTNRVEIYKPLLDQKDCPIKVDDITSLFYDPYEQLMRQTLLAWSMCKAKEYNAQDWLHLHVIPKENTELRNRNTSPKLFGKNMSEVWKSVLVKL